MLCDVVSYHFNLISVTLEMGPCSEIVVFPGYPRTYMKRLFPIPSFVSYYRLLSPRSLTIHFKQGLFSLIV